MSVTVSELWGKVVATSSKLNIGSTKLELIMKKKTSGTWKKLHAEEIGATVFFGMRDKKPDIWVSPFSIENEFLLFFFSQKMSSTIMENPPLPKPT